MKIQDLFQLGMKRTIPDLAPLPRGIAVNLGAGNSAIEGAISLDFPKWNAENYIIEVPAYVKHEYTNPGKPYPLPKEASQLLVPAPDESIAVIHAYHFLEHLHHPLRMLQEFNRVLMRGGVANICVPHFSGSMAHQDMDHKHTFAIESWSNALNNEYYNKDRSGWKLKIHFNIMIAIVERNACILTQLVKE